MLIVNSCIGGFWIEEARRLCLGGENGLTIITGGRSDEMIYAHSISGSGKARGGYFVNALTAALHRQYGLFFSAARDPPAWARECLQGHIHRENHRHCAERRSAPDRVGRLGNLGSGNGQTNGPSAYGAIISHPQVSSIGGMLCTEAFGVQPGNELPLRPTHAVPSSPRCEFQPGPIGYFSSQEPTELLDGVMRLVGPWCGASAGL
jgi:hypothetical protein